MCNLIHGSFRLWHSVFFVCGYQISEEPASILRTHIRIELRLKWQRTAAMRNTQRTVRAKGGPTLSLTSAVNGDEWEASRHGRFVLNEILCVRQEAEWVPLPVCTLCRKGISLLLPELKPRFLCRPALILVTIMTDVSQLFTFSFFIRILLSASNNFLRLISSTLFTLK